MHGWPSLFLSSMEKREREKVTETERGSQGEGKSQTKWRSSFRASTLPLQGDFLVLLKTVRLRKDLHASKPMLSHYLIYSRSQALH